MSNKNDQTKHQTQTISLLFSETSYECTIEEKNVAKSLNKVDSRISDNFSKKRRQKKNVGKRRNNKRSKNENASDTATKSNPSVGEENKNSSSDNSKLSNANTFVSQKAVQSPTTEKKN